MQYLRSPNEGSDDSEFWRLSTLMFTELLDRRRGSENLSDPGQGRMFKSNVLINRQKGPNNRRVNSFFNTGQNRENCLRTMNQEETAFSQITAHVFISMYMSLTMLSPCISFFKVDWFIPHHHVFSSSSCEISLTIAGSWRLRLVVALKHYGLCERKREAAHQEVRLVLLSVCPLKERG